MPFLKKSNISSKDKKFLKDHKQQLKDLLKLQEVYCNTIYDNPNIDCHNLFVMPKSEIVNLLCQFFSDTITDDRLKRQLIDNIQGKNPNVKVNLLDDPSDPRWKKNGATGRIKEEDIDNKTFFKQDIGRTQLTAHAGINKGNGLVETHFEHIIGIAHETAHSASQKHNGKDFVPPVEDCLGEIESTFIEKLLLEYLDTNAEKISAILQNKGFEKISAGWLRHEVAIKRKQMDIGLLKNLQIILQEESGTKPKFYTYRYVVGEVYSNMLLEAYHKNPEVIIQNYAEFVKQNSLVDLDKATQILSGDALRTQGQVLDAFTKLQHLKMQTALGIN